MQDNLFWAVLVLAIVAFAAGVLLGFTVGYWLGHKHGSSWGYGAALNDAGRIMRGESLR